MKSSDCGEKSEFFPCIPYIQGTLLNHSERRELTMVSARWTVALAACAAVLPEVAAFMAPLPLGAARMGSRSAATTRPVQSLRATAAAAPHTVEGYGDMSNIVLSGLKGVALKDKVFPTKREVEAIMPEGTWNRDDKVLCVWECVCTSFVPGPASLLVYAALFASASGCPFPSKRPRLNTRVRLQVCILPIFRALRVLGGARKVILVGCLADLSCVCCLLYHPVVGCGCAGCCIPAHDHGLAARLGCLLVRCRNYLDWNVGYCARVWPRCLLGQQGASRHHGICLAHCPHGALFLVAALARCAPFKNQPRLGG